MLERKIQTYTTNESGQKIVTYQGQGLGERKLVVQKNGRTVSETYPVIDALFLDTFTNHNTKWWVSQTSASIEATTDGVIFSSENVASTTYSRNLCYITDSFPTIWADQEEACKFLTSSFCFEFDIVDVLNSTQIIINCIGIVKSVLNISNGDKIKLVYDGSYLTFYKNSEVYNRVAFTFADNKTWIGFNIFGGYKIKLNNLRVYPI